MSEIDLVLLGLIKEQPQSAYDLQKNIEYRDISYWVRISNPSIYKNIKQLEEKHYIKGKTIKNGNMPEKAVFELTKEGETYFREEMLKVSDKQVRLFLSLNAVLLNLDQMETDVEKQCLANIRRQIALLKEHIERKEQERGEIPENGKMIMRQQKELILYLDQWAAELKVHELIKGEKEDEC